jgi:predicted transcriptional regulator of viral defense system
MRGIDEANRALLECLHRRTAGPFSVQEAANILAVDPRRASRLLRYLAERGWLSRVRRGLYTTVPLGATQPSAWREDPWAIAVRVFASCYIGGWSAAEYWALTDQIFRSLMVMTARPVRAASTEIQGQPFRLKHMPEERQFGKTVVWRDRVRAHVSDPSRTVLDLLNDPAVGGGIRHGAAVLLEYWAGEHCDEGLLADYAHRLGNRTVYKRLGFLLEHLAIEAPKTIQTCLDNLSTGISTLDPTVQRKGRIVKRWNLRINVVPIHSALQ